MKITKFQHACFTYEKEGAAVVVDPGTFTRDFVLPDHVVAIVVTHSHPDHFDPELIAHIIAQNPSAELLAAEDVTVQFPDAQTRTVQPGETITLEGITLAFYGGTHAEILPPIQTPTNLAVHLDETVYFAGDSYTTPPSAVTYLALPVSAPWLKVSEAAAYLQAVKPKFAFPTHDAILSDDGKAIVDRILGGAAEAIGATYERLDGKSITLS